DLVFPHESLAALGGRNFDHAKSGLPVPTRLLHVAAFGAAVTRHGLAIRNARRLCGRVNPVLPLQLLESHVQVYVAQSGDDELFGLLDPLDVQGRVFLCEPSQAAGDLLLIAAGLWRDREAVGGRRQIERRDRAAVFGAERVPSERVGQLRDRADVAGVDFGRSNVLLAPREEDLRQALIAAAVPVGEGLVGLDRTGHDLEVADAAELVATGAEH